MVSPVDVGWRTGTVGSIQDVEVGDVRPHKDLFVKDGGCGGVGGETETFQKDTTRIRFVHREDSGSQDLTGHRSR